MKKITNTDKYELSRFINAQKLYHESALTELKNGKKENHWMWYIFPQLKDLGYSDRAKYYGIKDLEEAKAYLEIPELKKHLFELLNVLLNLESDNAEEIFGWPDNLKLRSCLTLFEKAEPNETLFGSVIDKFFDGERDPKTLSILGD